MIWYDIVKRINCETYGLLKVKWNNNLKMSLNLNSVLVYRIIKRVGSIHWNVTCSRLFHETDGFHFFSSSSSPSMSSSSPSSSSSLSMRGSVHGIILLSSRLLFLLTDVLNVNCSFFFFASQSVSFVNSVLWVIIYVIYGQIIN